MKINKIINSCCDAFEFFILWFFSWFLVILVAPLPLTAVARFFSREALLTLYFSLFGILAVVAIYDFSRRLRGQKNLITLFFSWCSLGRLEQSKFGLAVSKFFDQIEIFFGKLFAALGKLLAAIGMLLGGVVLLVLGGLLIYGIFNGVAALPISVAIVIGALIIAGASKDK